MCQIFFRDGVEQVRIENETITGLLQLDCIPGTYGIAVVTLTAFYIRRVYMTAVLYLDMIAAFPHAFAAGSTQGFVYGNRVVHKKTFLHFFLYSYRDKNEGKVTVIFTIF
jgi:hypothetical protein